MTLDARRQQLIGVRTSRAERVMVAPEVRAVGTVRADETRLTEINVRADGWIRDLRADFTGRPVRQGETLFSLYSPDLIATQNEYLLAVRGQTQAIAGQVPELRDIRRVSSRRRASGCGDGTWARRRSRSWSSAGAAFETVPVRSPVSGVIVEKTAIEGMHVMPGADAVPDRAIARCVWVEADVYERDMAAVRVGQSGHRDARCVSGSTLCRAADLRLSLRRRADAHHEGALPASQSSRAAQARHVRERAAGRAVGVGLAVPADAVLDSGKRAGGVRRARRGLFRAAARANRTPRRRRGSKSRKG